MISCSRIMLSFLNIIILITAVSQILMATHLHNHSGQSLCLHDNASSLLWMGIFFLITAIVGILGACFKLKGLQNIYLWVLLLSTIFTLIFSTFISAMMPKNSAYHTYLKTGADGFWLKEYTPALQRALVNDKDWFRVKTCYEETKICEVMKKQTGGHGFRYIEIGCCKPPYRCYMLKQNSSSSVGHDMDEECRMWARVGRECFDCDSCKAAYLANYQEQWDHNILSQVARIFLLMPTSALAFYAFREDDDSNDQKQGKHVRI